MAIGLITKYSTFLLEFDANGKGQIDEELYQNNSCRNFGFNDLCFGMGRASGSDALTPVISHELTWVCAYGAGLFVVFYNPDVTPTENGPKSVQPMFIIVLL